MSSDTTSHERDAEVIPLRAAEARTEGDLADTPAPAYVETGKEAARLRNAIPEPFRRANLPGTVTRARVLAAHHVKFHGVRVPFYVAVHTWWAVRGGFLAGHKLTEWLAWRHGWVLESQAVARGPAGHREAMTAHTQRTKTTGNRWKITLAVAGTLLVLLLVMARFAPWWVWVLLLLALAAAAIRHGKPRDKQVLKSAVIPAVYEKPTHAVITKALGSLSIKAINDAIGDGRGLHFLTDVYRDGEGWGCDLDLPHGVTARMILQRRDQLSAGLRRPLSATWPEGVPEEHEARLRLWIGFTDVSKVKQKPWPLLRAGQADVFAPFPFAVDPRGRQVDGALFEHNWLIGSAPGQGKTGAIRVLACVTALDPLAEMWIHELKGIGDLEQFADVCHRYVSGLDDEAIGYAADSMRKLRAELEHRSGVLRRLPREAKPEGKVTRELAARRSLGLFPLIAYFDEVQNLFMHERYGKQAQDDAAYVVRVGRAYGIILVLSTQRPTSETVPTSVTGNVTTRFCLHVPGQIENDTILGTGSYKTGYNAVLFRPKTDAGMGWLRGENAVQVARTYKLDLADAARVVERARVLRGQAGTLTGYALGQDDDEPARSFAADVVAVFGGDVKLHTATIARRLADRIPQAYADVTPAAVGSQLRALGVTVKNVREPGSAPAPGAERAAVEAIAP